MVPDRFADVTTDTALGGRVRVCQPARGFRFSVDAVLLARFAAQNQVERAVELGCGCGVVSLCLLALGACRSVRGMDVQPAFVELARRGAEMNDFGARASFEVADVRRSDLISGKGEAQLVVTNPPYRPVSSSRLSPDPSLATAKFEVQGALPHFVDCAARLLARGGEFCAVYPAGRIDHLLGALSASALNPTRLRLYIRGLERRQVSCWWER